MPRDETPEDGLRANPGYAAFQIAKALATSDSHEDEATRERAHDKVNKWVSVLGGILSGRFEIGSRQPIPEMPVWATPEVVTGGFVTGRLLAGGMLQPHEAQQLQHIGRPPEVTERQTLNAYYLSDQGLAELTVLLKSGCYEVAVPEEGALLVVAWLAANGHAESARNLVDVIAPYFETLRFYPVPVQRPPTFGSRVYLENVGTTLERVRSIKPNSRVMAQREAIQVWTPLYDRMLGLFLETVSGEWPTIQPDADGRWVSTKTRKFAIVGGWPCQRFTANWRERAATVLADFDRLRAAHSRCGKPARAEDAFARLRGYLKRCADDPRSLNGCDVGMIRLILARHIAKHGGPDSEKLRQLRARQDEQAAAPTFHEIAVVVQERLASYPPDAGLDAVDDVIASVNDDEARQFKIASGTKIPEAMCKKLARCLCETAEVLVEHGIITSGETLARVIPQFTSGLRAAAFDDPSLRRHYAATYRAFRRRRSLLLFNLEKQVRIEELPWVAAMEPFRRADLSARELSHRALKEVTMLTLRAFPQSIIPNKLLQEFRALAQGAKLKLPLVEELAADIFMDDLSPKFTEAAKHSVELIEGSLYARYYELDVSAIRRLPDSKPEPLMRRWFSRETPGTLNPLVELCIKRAGVSGAPGCDVARNGMVLEQAQILTTQNLAVLFQSFSLGSELRDEFRNMAECCFRWICRRQQAKTDQWHAKRIMLKNTAYAWRQMIFYMSHLSNDEVGAFLKWAEEHLNQQADDFRARFAPALRGLALVHAGRSIEDVSPQTEAARRFLGWTKTRHWLLGEDSSQPPR